jgi:hypothetical protein
MSVVYGHQIAPKDDHFVNIAEQAMAMVNEAVQPGATAVNALPFRASWSFVVIYCRQHVA